MTEPVPPAAGPPGAAGSARSSDSPGAAAGQPVVLVARAPERAAGLLALLRERGLDPIAAPVIERAPVEDPAELDAARERLADGAYTWVAITSVNAVDALLGPAPDGAAANVANADGAASAGEDTTSAGSVAESRQRLLRATHLGVDDSPPTDTPAPSDTPSAGSVESRSVHPGPVRWAAVGPATERALAARGVTADLVPRTATGAGLADAFPVAPKGLAPRVLLPLGDLASDTLRAGLAAKGWVADVVTAYRTVARELPAELRGPYDVVVVTSGSAARQLAAQLGPQRVVAIGEPSAGTARAVGHTVLAVAATPTDAALADAVTEALVRT